MKLKKERELDIAKALEDYQSRVHPKGETLPESTRVFRVKVVTAMLRAGIPLQRADALREVLEENGYSLTDSSHLRELITLCIGAGNLKRKSVGSNYPLYLMVQPTFVKRWL